MLIQLAGPAVTTVAEYKGTPQTLLMMARYALGAEGEANHYVRQWAESLVSKVSPKDYLSEILAVHDWGTGPAIRYTNDAKHVEQVKTPLRMLKEIAEQGSAMLDCDDIATLLASMLMTLGREVEFVIVGFKEGGDFTHVFIRVKEPKTGAWIVVDPVAGQNDAKMLRNTKKWATCAVEPGRLTIVPGDKSMKPIIVDDTFMSGFGASGTVKVSASTSSGDWFKSDGGGGGGASDAQNCDNPTNKKYCQGYSKRPVKGGGPQVPNKEYSANCCNDPGFRALMQQGQKNGVLNECEDFALNAEGGWSFAVHKKCMLDSRYRASLKAQKATEAQLQDAKAQASYNAARRQQEEAADRQNTAIDKSTRAFRAIERSKRQKADQAKIAALEAEVKRLAAAVNVATKLAAGAKAGAYRLINPATGKGAQVPAGPMTDAQKLAILGVASKTFSALNQKGPAAEQPPAPEAQPPTTTDIVFFDQYLPDETGPEAQWPTDGGYPSGEELYGRELYQGPSAVAPDGTTAKTEKEEEKKPNYPLYIGAAAVVLVGLYLVTKK